jgi:dihydrodipicolinate synthase/N-acetylneuraminate lyase
MKKLTTKGLTRSQMRGYSIVPLLTPFDRSGQLDSKSLEKVIEHIIAGGCQGLMVCGTTGEFASMSVAQRVQVVREAVRIARGRAVIFGGIGDTCLEHSLTLAREFLAAGADSVVGNLPSYYPLTPEMMERYFTRLADGIDGPVYLYNIPQTTRQSIPLEVIERLSRHPRIVGLKDSEPDAVRQEQVCRMFAGREDFVVFCGSIAFSSKAMRAGADGIVPGAGNFAPQLARQLMDKLVSGDVAAGDAAQQRMDAVNATYQKGRTISQLFCALKAIMEIKGLCARHMLPPLTDATDAEVAQIKAALAEIGA